MGFYTRPVAGATLLRTSGKSFLSIFLSIAFVFPAEIGLPAPVVAAVPAPEDGHGRGAPLHKDKKAKQDPALKGLPITELSADEAILHALNRLAYGPRPGDVERVRQMGLAKWIEQQLNPNAIEDRAVEARLEQFPTLRMSTAKLLAEYPQLKASKKSRRRLKQRGWNSVRSSGRETRRRRRLQGTFPTMRSALSKGGEARPGDRPEQEQAVENGGTQEDANAGASDEARTYGGDKCGYAPSGKARFAWRRRPECCATCDCG